MALVPEAVAFAFVAGVDPLVGLYAAFMVGLITACIGGRPGMISGATGALAVVMVMVMVMVSLVADQGVEYLCATVVLMGVLQITAGALELGKFIRMVPHPVMLGFVNGLAIVIFLAQPSLFGVAGEPGWLHGSVLEGSLLDVAWLEGAQLQLLVGLVAPTVFIIHFLPRFTTAVPSSLVVIVVVSLMVFGLDLGTRVVGGVVIDFARSRVADHSGPEAIDTLAERYLSAGKMLHLVHLSADCRQLLRRAAGLVEVNVIDDPQYFVADDALD